MRHSDQAITLVELLVSIAIITVLVGILMPAIPQDRAAAQQSTCLTNLKSIGLAVVMYADDYDGYMPLAAPVTLKGQILTRSKYVVNSYTEQQKQPFINENVAVINAIMPYVRSTSVFCCPSTTIVTSDKSAPGKIGKNGIKVSYAYNGYLNAYSLDSVKSPNNLVSVWEGYGPYNYPGYAISSPNLPCQSKGITADKCRFGLVKGTETAPAFGLMAIHRKVMNCVRADGSARAIMFGGSDKTPDPRYDPCSKYDKDHRCLQRYSDTEGYIPFFRPDSAF